MNRDVKQLIGAVELRQRAEEKLKRQTAKSEEVKSAVDVQRLIHELQVHQIELELQNEELQEARAEMEAALERYTDLYDFAPSGYLTLERDSTISLSNLNAAQLLGAERTRLVGKRFGLFVSVADRPTFNNFFAQVFASQARQSCEVALVREDQPPRTVTIEGICSPDGRTCRAVVTDISQIRAAQRELARLGVVAKNTAAAVLITDAGGRIEWANVAFTAMSGYDLEEVVGLRPGDLLQGPRTDPAVVEQMRLALARQEGFNVEILNYGKNGSPFWNHLKVDPVFDPAGGLIQFIGVQENITLRKATEEALRESHRLFETLVNSLPMILWMTDPEGSTTFINRQWSHLTGHSSEDALEFGWTALIHPQDVDAATQAFHQAIHDRQPFQIEFRRLYSDEKYHSVAARGVPCFSEQGDFLGLIGFSMDVTEQKALREQLFESQKLESLGRLAGGIAHDFNNLLTVILNSAEMMEETLSSRLPDQSAGDIEMSSLVNHVTSAASRASDLTRQLLTYARRQMVEFTQVDINQIVREMEALLRRAIGEKYELVSRLTSRVCHAHTNATQIEQVLMNLVVNARDAMPEGGRIFLETSAVTLDADYALSHLGVSPGSYVLLAVSDTGMGMTKEIEQRIFDPFFTTKGVGKGTGLGLATCYGIVKQSKGNIWVYSELGQGTTFKVYLPLVNATPSAPISVPQAQQPKGTATVLVVDDEPMVRAIAVRVLRKEGYRVLEAKNGAEALLVQNECEGAIDLLLTDAMMPLMGGKELADRLRKVRPAIKVLFMSGYTQDVIVQEGIIEPNVALLTKPFTAISLSRRVSEALHAL